MTDTLHVYNLNSLQSCILLWDITILFMSQTLLKLVLRPGIVQDWVKPKPGVLASHVVTGLNPVAPIPIQLPLTASEGSGEWSRCLGPAPMRETQKNLLILGFRSAELQPVSCWVSEPAEGKSRSVLLCLSNQSINIKNSMYFLLQY